MRVLMVTPRFAPFAGGVETHTYEVARRLSAQGVETSILTCDPSGDLPTSDVREGFNVHRIPAYPRKQDWYWSPEIFDWLQAGRWDVVHCQGYHTFVAPLAMVAAHRARIPYVVTFHSGGHSSWLRSHIRLAQRWALRPFLAQASQLIGVSQFEAAMFEHQLKLPPQRFKVIPNGSQLAATGDTIVPESGLILSVGRLERYKGHQRIIAAMPKILTRYPNAHLRIVGTGPYEAALKEQINHLGMEHCVTIQPISGSDREGMARLLQHASLVTLFSDYEAHPISVMEALACGRPVLATDTSGLRELGERGWIKTIPLHSDSGQIAQSVIQQLENPTAPDKIALPTWEDCAAQLLEVYRNVSA